MSGMSTTITENNLQMMPFHHVLRSHGYRRYSALYYQRMEQTAPHVGWQMQGPRDDITPPHASEDLNITYKYNRQIQARYAAPTLFVGHLVAQMISISF